jgi:hypothetical protein
MKRLLYPLIVLLLIGGCADTINNSETADPAIKIQISKPLENDSIGYRGSIIEYELKTAAGINFIELYINNEFIQNYPSKNNQKPVINIYLDSTYSGQKIELYLVYFDKNGSSTKSNVIKNVNVAGDRSVPSKPFNLRITKISSATLNVAWQDTSRNVTGYEIWRRENASGEFIKHLDVSGAARNINDINLAPEKIYYYKIRGNSANGFSEYSDVIGTEGSGGTFNIPPPSNLTATINDLKVIHLRWKDNSVNENYFKIERRREWTLFETIGYTEKNTEFFCDSANGLLAGAEYYYRIKAVSENDSSWSNDIYIFMPQYILKAPSLVSLTNTSSRRLLIKWKDNDQQYADFVIERKETGGDFIVVGRASNYLSSFVDSVHPLKNYTYRVKQDDGIYTSFYSDEKEMTTAIVPIPAPENLNGYFDGNSIIISWEYSSDAEEFIIERRDSTDGTSFSQLAVINGDKRAFTDNATLCQHVYIYRIKASDTYTISSFSSEKAIKNWKVCP